MRIDNRDLDTGYIVQPGGYPLTDKTFAELLFRITGHPNRQVPSALKHDILGYYSDENSPIVTKKDPRAWKRVQDELALLRGMPVVSVQ